MTKNSITIVTSTIFNKTEQTHSNLSNKLIDFIRTKSENPTQRFGSSDYQFTSDAPLGGKLKLSHAHLSQDVCVVYRIKGKPPTLYLFGLFSHKELGTGNTANIKLQKSMHDIFKNQFPDLSEDEEN